ncbi:MAG: SET domain-containing protein-lysine N-methyltransferase [Methylococcales bacterium]|nr:SET domain-containing protein-lysine N-methyltransferase [Methylococcales bacterium]
MKKSIDASENLIVFYNPTNRHYAIKAAKNFPIDSIVQVFSAKEYLQQPTYLSVQLDENKHIHLFPEFLQYTNHSCEPNTFFDTQKGEIIAIKEIAKNEEISFFYPSTEWSMSQPFKCLCNSRSCLGMIQGAAHLENNVVINYRFSDYIQKKLYQK